MDAKELPARANLEQYRKQAKDLVKNCKSGDPEALRRIEHRSHSAKLALADAQLLIAREHGFASWPKFAKYLESRERERSPEFIWELAEKALIAGDVSTLDRLLRENEAMFRDRRPPGGSGGLAPDYSGGETRAILVRNHQFEDWAQFELSRNNPAVAKFEAAVDAVVAGDVRTLRQLIRENPALIRERSTRTHQATLLHYAGANGVEYFRQKTPKNAVKIAEALIEVGAEIDAEAKMYGGSTTLGLVATSIHPVLAGVQNALMETLLDSGATLDSGAVNGCLANGRPGAAEFLARRGARLDLDGASGVGRLDLVKGFFNEDGRLRAGATSAQMKSGFQWACEYGRIGVVDFLLEKSVDVGTGLHWAALGGRSDIVKLLLEHSAPLEAKDETWGGTPLSWVLYGWSNPSPGVKADRYYDVAALLVAAGAKVNIEWTAAPKVLADPAMRAALGV